MDFDSIPAGVDFREHIRRAIDRSHVVIALIGPNWLGDKTGFRGIDNPDDFVRFEISLALARCIPVIPVLVNDAKMPEAEELPADLKELAFRNALPLDSGLDFHSHAERLVCALRAISPFAHRGSRVWRHPLFWVVTILTVIIMTSLVRLVVTGFFRNQEPSAKLERLEKMQQPMATTTVPTPSSSSPVAETETITSSPLRSPEASVSPVSIRALRGRWSSINSSPIAGNGTLTVNDQLVVEEEEITETIKTEWIADGTSVFRITLRVRFGELWAFKNQLNARCLAADVVDMKDPKDFGKYANMREQATNGAKAGVGLVYTWTLNGSQLQRGGTMWSRQK
jgi:hypothetical protein